MKKNADNKEKEVKKELSKYKSLNEKADGRIRVHNGTENGDLSAMVKTPKQEEKSEKNDKEYLKNLLDNMKDYLLGC